MIELPATKYVSVGDSVVAYNAVGDGPLDLLYFYGLGSHVDLFWQEAESAQWLRTLTSFGRLIFFDRRGTGASDAVEVAALPTWEQWTEDLLAVLDAADSKRAAIFASLDAGPIAMLFASTYPSRVSSLILANTSARFLADVDYPIGVTGEEIDAVSSVVQELWGTEELLQYTNPDVAEEVPFTRDYARRLRASATPRTAAAQYRYLMESLDVRPVLSLIQTPTLVLHTCQNPIVPVSHGRYIAEHVDGATFVELAGRGVSLNDGQARTAAIEEISHFLTGVRMTSEPDRVLRTILFTDIVASTERAVALGDARWRRLLDAHDRAVRDRLQRWNGVEVKTTGDGFLASFDGPGRAIRCAQAIIAAAGELGIAIRAGVHTGECEVRDHDLAGLAVHIAARVGALAGECELLVTRTVVDLVAGSGIDFVDRGQHVLKGVPGSAQILQVQP